MKANYIRRHEERIAVVIATALSLLVVAGCTAEDPGHELTGLLGDLARQLLTCWIL